MTISGPLRRRLSAFAFSFGTTFPVALALGKSHHLAVRLTGLLYAVGWLGFYGCLRLCLSFRGWHERRRLRRLWRRVEAEAFRGIRPAERSVYPDRPPQPDRRY